MPLESKDIEGVPRDGLCAHAAVVNVFKLRGLTPPALEEVGETFAVARGIFNERLGFERVGADPIPLEVLSVLNASGKFVVLLGEIPPQYAREPHKLLTHFLDIHGLLVLFYTWRDPETDEDVPHAVVAEGYDSRGFLVLDSESAVMEGTTIELEPSPPSAELIEAARLAAEDGPRGCRRVLPFYETATLDNPLGLLPQFVVIYL
jgi:hypothetical protein